MQMVNSSKLVLWTEAKVIKMAESIYEELVNQGKKSHKNEKDNDMPTEFEDVATIIKDFFIKKYKTDKLMKENLANLIYSLDSHITKWEGCIDTK